jgi:hypothetical protein
VSRRVFCSLSKTDARQRGRLCFIHSSNNELARSEAGAVGCCVWERGEEDCVGRGVDPSEVMFSVM